jgi:hypothetical protein
MPVYTVRTPTSTRNSWAEGLKSLADAFAPPDPKYGIMAAELGMKREQMDFEQGMDRDRYALDEQRLGIAREEADANIARMEAAAEQAHLAGETEVAQKLYYGAQQLKVEADAALTNQKLTAGNDFKTLISSGDPTKLDEVFGAAALGDDIEADPAQIGAVLGMTPEKLDPYVYAETGNYPNTLTGSREGLAAQMERQMAEPLTIGPNQQAIVPPEHQAYTPENKGRVGGLINVGENEEVRVPGPPGTEDTVYTGADYAANPGTVQKPEAYTWPDPNNPGKMLRGMAFTVPSDEPPGYRVLDVNGMELPYGAYPASFGVNAANSGDLVLTEAKSRKADLLPQIVMGVQDMNDLVGYDPATNEFKDGGTFPGLTSVIGNTVESLVGAIAGQELGTYAGLVTRRDFDNEYDYQMFRITEPLLRFRSGAATPDQEVARYRQYAPRAGESRELAQEKIRDLNRIANAMSYVAQAEGIPIAEVIAYTTIPPGGQIMNPELRVKVEAALAESKAPTVSTALPLGGAPEAGAPTGVVATPPRWSPVVR